MSCDNDQKSPDTGRRRLLQGAAALRELERGGLRASVYAAVDAAKTRSEQLGITSE